AAAATAGRRRADETPADVRRSDSRASTRASRIRRRRTLPGDPDYRSGHAIRLVTGRKHCVSYGHCLGGERMKSHIPAALRATRRAALVIIAGVCAGLIAAPAVAQTEIKLGHVGE